MALITATEVTIYSNITASAATITTSNLIPDVQDTINLLTGNYFTTELFFEDSLTFNATARTIVTGTVHFEEYNFLAGDDIYVYRSYRNDGYYTLLSVSENTATLATGSSVVDELSGQSILLSVVKWPVPVKHIAAQMIAYDYDVRGKKAANVKSYSLGPLSETFTVGEEDEYGYPKKLTDKLAMYRIARLM